MLLTEREFIDDVRNSMPDCCVPIPERVDAPTANQVAVVWVQDQGLAPKLEGIDFVL